MIASMRNTDLPEGLTYLPRWFGADGQQELMAAVADGVRRSPFYVPTMPRTGRAFSVRMTNFGRLGWVADKAGYRYQPHHPVTGTPWPKIPPVLLELWQALGAPKTPDACLVNHYLASSKLGMHRDSDEETYDAPVVSISLGDSAVFRIGGTVRKSPTRTIHLGSGDVIAFGGPARLIYHGVDRVLSGSSTLVPWGGRVNLTLRRVRSLTEGGA